MPKRIVSRRSPLIIQNSLTIREARFLLSKPISKNAERINFCLCHTFSIEVRETKNFSKMFSFFSSHLRPCKKLFFFSASFRLLSSVMVGRGHFT